MSSICLNMIVKNERDVIRRCLSSVKGIIDSWIIVDTGSTDGTQEVIREFMSDIPGELFERPWVDFAHNRNEALTLAKGKGDYLLFIDADEELLFSHTFQMPKLDGEMYLIPVDLPEGISYLRQLLVDQKKDWRWEGVIHEEIDHPDGKKTELLAGVRNRSRPAEGCRGRDPLKYWRDAQILERALEKEPQNARYAFFLAQSYQVGEMYELALSSWEKRVLLGGSEQEVYYALYAIARIQLLLGFAPEIFLEGFERAHRFRPSRAEPLFWRAYFEFGRKNFEEAYRLVKEGIEIPLPSDHVYVEQWIYDYGLPVLAADCAFALEKVEEMRRWVQRLEANPKVSPDHLAVNKEKLLYLEQLR
ncbi:MAG: glycosyltransferase [Verrucomicrobia bacterium]|nr:glycosyltransferase [Verrucomicrobiota bacterium]